MILIDNRNTSDPYLNLAIEEYLVRHADCGKDSFLMLYVNEPCIVLGKNQSIYREVNFEFLRNGKLQLARRITGGGTVYQDTGNLNFSFISKFEDHKVNNYAWFNQSVVDALNKVGINAEMDARNNIICGGKKISGNAQFTNRKNIISHGTLLFDADLTLLRACLKPNDFEIETKAVASVPSPVMNIKEASRRFALTGDLKVYLAEELIAGEIYSLSEQEWSAIQKLADDKFRKYEWIYGRSPLTTIKKHGVELEVEDGIISKISNQKSQISNLVGVPYQFESIKKALEYNPNASQLLSAIF